MARTLRVYDSQAAASSTTPFSKRVLAHELKKEMEKMKLMDKAELIHLLLSHNAVFDVTASVEELQAVLAKVLVTSRQKSPSEERSSSSSSSSASVKGQDERRNDDRQSDVWNGISASVAGEWKAVSREWNALVQNITSSSSEKAAQQFIKTGEKPTPFDESGGQMSGEDFDGHHTILSRLKRELSQLASFDEIQTWAMQLSREDLLLLIRDQDIRIPKYATRSMLAEKLADLEMASRHPKQSEQISDKAVKGFSDPFAVEKDLWNRLVGQVLPTVVVQGFNGLSGLAKGAGQMLSTVLTIDTTAPNHPLAMVERALIASIHVLVGFVTVVASWAGSGRLSPQVVLFLSGTYAIMKRTGMKAFFASLITIKLFSSFMVVTSPRAIPSPAAEQVINTDNPREA
eukprot:scaffold2312_cov165-Ochromonas_danica.AAC.73